MESNRNFNSVQSGYMRTAFVFVNYVRSSSVTAEIQACIWLYKAAQLVAPKSGLRFAAMTKILRLEQYSTNIHDHCCGTCGFSSFIEGLLNNSWIALKTGAADTSETL